MISLPSDLKSTETNIHWTGLCVNSVKAVIEWLVVLLYGNLISKVSLSNLTSPSSPLPHTQGHRHACFKLFSHAVASAHVNSGRLYLLNYKCFKIWQHNFEFYCLYCPSTYFNRYWGEIKKKLKTSVWSCMSSYSIVENPIVGMASSDWIVWSLGLWSWIKHNVIIWEAYLTYIQLNTVQRQDT